MTLQHKLLVNLQLRKRKKEESGYKLLEINYNYPDYKTIQLADEGIAAAAAAIRSCCYQFGSFKFDSSRLDFQNILHIENEKMGKQKLGHPFFLTSSYVAEIFRRPPFIFTSIFMCTLNNIFLVFSSLTFKRTSFCL